MANRIWKWADDEWKAYCKNNADYRKIMSWKGTQHGSTYYFPDGSVRYDVIVPRRLHNRAAALLGFPHRVRIPAKRQETSSQVVVAHRAETVTGTSKRRLECDQAMRKAQNPGTSPKPPTTDWHRWVYGGERNPLLDVKPIPDRWKLPKRFD